VIHPKKDRGYVRTVRANVRIGYAAVFDSVMPFRPKVKSLVICRNRDRLTVFIKYIKPAHHSPFASVGCSLAATVAA
jgi:hypothetical protein